MDPQRPNQPSPFVANLDALEIPNGLPNIPAFSVGIPSNQGLPGIQFALPAVPSTIPEDMTHEAREELYDTVLNMSVYAAQKAAIDARSVQSHVKLLRLMNNFSRMENAAAVAANQDVVPLALMGSSTSSAQLQLEAPKETTIVPAARPLGQQNEDTAFTSENTIEDARDSCSSEITDTTGIITDTTNDAPNRGLPDDSSKPLDAITTASISPKPLEDVTIVPTDSNNTEAVQSTDALEKKDEIKSAESESVDVNGSSNVTDHCEVPMEQDEVVDAPIALNEPKTLPSELDEGALLSLPKNDHSLLSLMPIEDEAVKTSDISDKNDSHQMQNTILSDSSNVSNHESLPMEQSHDDDSSGKSDPVETQSEKNNDDVSDAPDTIAVVSQKLIKDEAVETIETPKVVDSSRMENDEKLPEEKAPGDDSNPLSMKIFDNKTVEITEPKVEDEIILSFSDHLVTRKKQSPDDNVSDSANGQGNDGSSILDAILAFLDETDEYRAAGSSSKLESLKSDEGQSAQVSTHGKLESAAKTSEKSASKGTRARRADNKLKAKTGDPGATTSKRTRSRRAAVESETDRDEFTAGPVKRTRRSRVKVEPLDSK